MSGAKCVDSAHLVYLKTVVVVTGHRLLPWLHCEAMSQIVSLMSHGRE